jgi:hypothetical protein
MVCEGEIDCLRGFGIRTGLGVWYVAASEPSKIYG